MRLSHWIIAVLLSGLGSGVEAASDKTTTGTVLALDPARCTVTLDDKSAYQFGAHCDLSKLKIGEKMVIIWRQSGDLRQAVQIFVSG